MLTTGEEPPVAEPAPPADAGAVTAAGGSIMSMSWRARAVVALFVALAVAVVGTGVVIVRRALDHSVDPQALAAISAARLDTLDPSFPELTAVGLDTVGVVDCAQLICASAARRFTPPAHTTAASVTAAADAWASLAGLGTKGRAAATEVGCGHLGYAPSTDLTCDVATYDVPGQAGEHVHVYVELTPGPGAGTEPGAFAVAAIRQRVVTTVYVQVLTSASRT